ncbi:MAG: hypothetical protein HC841_03340 [Verrucomicrobiae bacterium]|nr:hypothetical protein [Verrucomicrobiae bacterium]
MGDVKYNRINYGIHSICPFRISDGLPYGILKVLGGGTMTLTSEYEELFGGSNKFAWAVEAKTISTEWTANVKSMPDFLFELFLGATVSTTAASATGTVNGLTEIKGNLVDATGIASVSALSGSDEDLKDGLYVIKAVDATTVDVYALSDLEFKKAGGAALTYVDDSLKVTATPLTITSGGDVTIPNTGVKITGGAGTIGMTAGDTAIFNVRSAHDGVSEITIGAAGTIFPEHKQLCVGQKRANGDTFELELYKVVGSGMPLPFEEQTFAIPELAMKLVYDEDSDKVAVIRAKKGV